VGLALSRVVSRRQLAVDVLVFHDNPRARLAVASLGILILQAVRWLALVWLLPSQVCPAYPVLGIVRSPSNRVYSCLLEQSWAKLLESGLARRLRMNMQLEGTKNSSRGIAAAVDGKAASHPGALPVARVEPNSGECRAKISGFGDYVDCLVDPTKRCHFALEFGGGALCRHSARLQIALRAKPSAATFILNSAAA